MKRDVVAGRGCRTLGKFKGTGFRSRRSIRLIHRFRSTRRAPRCVTEGKPFSQ